jgi:hypothetical protein
MHLLHQLRLQKSNKLIIKGLGIVASVVQDTTIGNTLII